jgi:hypothetical protein
MIALQSLEIRSQFCPLVSFAKKINTAMEITAVPTVYQRPEYIFPVAATIANAVAGKNPAKTAAAP